MEVEDLPNEILKGYNKRASDINKHMFVWRPKELRDKCEGAKGIGTVWYRNVPPVWVTIYCGSDVIVQIIKRMNVLVGRY